MAILDAIKIQKTRFTKWAEEYLDIPEQLYENGVIRYEDAICAYLIEKGVFTMEQMKEELQKKKIHFCEFSVKKELERNKA